MGDDIVKIDEHIGIGVNVVTPSFDYAKLNWQGFDLPKYVLDMSEQQRSYLQALAPNRLLNDELFSQAHAMMHLYRFGKVVWGAVVSADEKLYQPTTEVIDFDNFLNCRNRVSTPQGKPMLKHYIILPNNLQNFKTLIPANYLPTKPLSLCICKTVALDCLLTLIRQVWRQRLALSAVHGFGVGICQTPCCRIALCRLSLTQKPTVRTQGE